MNVEDVRWVEREMKDIYHSPRRWKEEQGREAGGGSGGIGVVVMVSYGVAMVV